LLEVLITKYMLNFIDIYIFIHVSGCVDMGISALLCPGAHCVVKTSLVRGKYILPQFLQFFDWILEVFRLCGIFVFPLTGIA